MSEDNNRLRFAPTRWEDLGKTTTRSSSSGQQGTQRPSGTSNLSNLVNQEVAQIDQKINLLKSLPTDQDGLRVTKQTGIQGTRDGQLRILGMNRDRLLAKAAGGQNEGFLGDVGSAVSSGAANFDKAIGYATGNPRLQEQARRRQQISGAEMTDYGREAREKGPLGEDMSFGQRAYATALALAESTPELAATAVIASAVGAAAPVAGTAAIGAKILSSTPRLARFLTAGSGAAASTSAKVVGERAIAAAANMGLSGTQAGLVTGSDTTAQVIQQIDKDPEAFANSKLGKELLNENGGNFEAAKIAAANEMGRVAAVTVGAVEALMTLPAAVFEARLLTGGTRRGIAKEAGSGLLAEGISEAPASANEQLVQNLSMKAVGSDVGALDGVAKAAGEGFIVGGALGGGLGAGGSVVNRLTGNAPDDQPRPMEDEELVSALSARGEATPPREGGGLIEDQNAVALRGMDNVSAGGMNYTPEQILDIARNNESNPRIADIMSQPVSDVTKVEQVARILNQEEVSRVEPEAVRRISGMFGGTNSVSTSKQMIADELAKISPAVIAESPTLSAISQTLQSASSGKQFVSGLRNAVSNYQPTAQSGTLFARPERGGEGSVILSQEDVTNEAQREREAQQAFRLADVRQRRFDTATGQRSQREDLRAGAPEPENQFFLNPAVYGEDLGGIAATIVGAEGGKVRIQYESPTEVDGNGTPVIISEDVDPTAMFDRVVRGTPRMSQELAGDLRKPRNGTGTNLNPRQSVDRTSTRAMVPTQDAGLPTTISPTRMTGFEANTDQLPVEQQVQNAQANPQQERAPNVEGNVEGPNEISGPPATPRLQAPEVQTAPAEETAPTEEAPAEEAAPAEAEQKPAPKKPAQDDGGKVEKHVENIGNKILNDDRSGVVSYADKVHKEGLIDDTDLAEIKRMSKDKDMGAEDIGPELISQLNTKRYSGRRETVRAPRKKASDVVRDTPLDKDKTAESEEVSKPEIDYDAVIQDRLDKIAARGAQGKVVASRLRSLLKQNNYDVTQLYYAFQMGEVVSRVLPKNAKVDILFVPSITASDAKAAAASGVDLGEEAAGSYDAYKISPNGFRGLITLSLSDNVTGASRENAAHEAFHVIQDMLRAYDPEAFKLLNNSFRDDMRIDDLDPSILRKLKTLTTDGEGSVYDGLIASLGDTPLSRFEAQAVAFGALVDAKDRGVDMKGLKASFIRVVDFISDMLRGFRNIFRINGVESVAEIFEGYRTGKAQEDMIEAAPLRDDEQQIQYSGRVPKNPAVTSSLEHNFNILQNKSFRKGRDLKMFIQERVKSSLDESGINAEDYEAIETFKYLTKMAVKDAEYALQENANAIGWYDEKVSKALAVLSLVHPEIATDRQSKFAFIWALAVSSNGLKVNPNFEIAEKAYRIYKETGAMPTDIGIGTAADAIDGHMKLFNVMMKKLGFDELERLMTTKATVKEIESETGISVSGEGKAETVFGAAILGPKIGNGFFANLYGHFDQLTMDRWLMRTWGRWTGTLVSIKEQNVEKGRDVLSRLVAALSNEQRSELGSIIGLNVDNADADTIAVAIQKSSIKPANRTKISDIGRGNTAGLEDIVGKQKGRFEQVGLGDEIRKKGNGLAGYLDGQKEAPAGANERKYIRSVFQNTLTTLKKKYPKLTTADLQALLWYPEKRLYEAAKTDEVNEGYDDDNAPDYANAAILVAKNAGVSDEQIRQANEAVDARLRSNVSSAGAGRGGAGVSEQYSGRTGRTDQDLATKLRSRFEGTPRVEEGSSTEGNVGRRSGGVLANSVTGRVPVAATYSHSTSVKDLFNENGFDTPDFHELTRGKAAGKLYTRLINDSKQDNRFGASVYVYPENEYQDMRLFVTKDGMSGFALKGDDIVSAFKSPKSADRGVAFSMIRMAVALGGRKLDAFDTVLPSIYSVSGFKAVSRMRWNDEFKPDDWNKETFKAFNGGEPDVVFMAYDQNREGLYSPDEGEYTDSYDQAVAAQGGDVQYSGRTSRAVYTPERTEKIIKAMSDGTNESKGWMTFMSPDEFLGLTLSKAGRDILATMDPTKTRARPLNIEELRQVSEPLFLTVREAGEISEVQRQLGVTSLPWQVMGHEGRHRMAAFKDAGIEQLPVVLMRQNGAAKLEDIANISLAPQRGGRSDQYNSGDTSIDVGEATPINNQNADRIRDMMTGEGIRFSGVRRPANLNIGGNASGPQALRPAYSFRSDNYNFGGEAPNKLDEVIYNLQDKLIDVKRIQKNIKDAGGRISETTDVYRAEELFHGRAAKRAKDFVQRELNPLLEEMKTKGVALEVLDKFLHARHAKERNSQIRKINPDMQDKGSGMSDAQADSYLAGLPNARRKQLEKLADRVDAITQSTQQMMVKYGLETQETIDNWNKTYKFYVPLQREGFEEGGSGSSGQGMSVGGSSSRRALGSELGVVDILANVAMQRERVISRGERNRVGNALTALALQNPNDSFWFVIDPKGADAAKAKKKLIDFGMDPADAENVMGAPMQRYIDQNTGRLVERPNSLFMNQPNVMATRINGEDKFVVFNNRNPRSKRMATALKNIDAFQMGAFVSGLAKFTRYFASINTQYNPAFGLYNLMRDLGGASINLSSTAIAGKQRQVIGNALPAAWGMYQDLRAERSGDAATTNWAALADEFELEGGKTGFRDLFATSQDRANAIEIELTGGSKLRQAATKVGGPVFDWLSDFNEAIENGVRLSAYKTAKEAGLSKAEAASIAKNLTVNFNRKGVVGAQAGAFYAFFNASVQGTARLAETLNGPAGKKIIAGGLLLGVAQSVALAAAGIDDEIPEWLKDKNLVIPLGGKKYVAIPMPLGLHVIPSLGRRSVEFFMSGGEKTPEQIIGLMGMMADSFNPIGNAGLSFQTLAPTVLDPLAALGENVDFAGREIARKDFNSLDPTAGYERNKEGVSAVGDYVARAIDSISGGNGYTAGALSPTGDQVDYLIGQLTGGVGRLALNTMATAQSAVTGEDLPNYKIPVVGRMIGDANEASAISGRFYDGIKEMNGHKKNVEGMEEDGKDTTSYFEDYPEAEFFDAAQDYERDISKLRKEKKQLKEDGASQQEIDYVTEEMQMLMVEFNQQIADYKKR
jgi:hypothetical protein